MPRRNNSTPGKLFCIDWPEWHVDCAGNCGDRALIAETGAVFTLREAEKRANKHAGEKAFNDWKKIKGLWYCPECAKGHS